MHDVIVVGAGMAGLVCARQLMRADLDVLVVEKSPGVGGRIATRRIIPKPEEPPIIVDHGAQFITADTDSLHRLIKELVSLDLLVEWTRSIHILSEQGLNPGTVDRQKPRYIAPQGMTSIAKYLAQSLKIVSKCRIIAVTVQDETWHLQAEDGQVSQCRHLVLAIPAPQILSVLPTGLVKSLAIYPLLASARYTACISVIAGYPRTTSIPEWRGIECHDSNLFWVTLDSSKRSQPGPPVLVLHATPHFSSNYLDADREALEQAGRALLSYGSHRLGEWIAKPVWMQVHRWRFAFPTENLGLASLATWVPRVPSAGSAQSLTVDTALSLICAGDWCGGPHIEGAWISGHDAANQLLSMMGKTPSTPSLSAL